MPKFKVLTNVDHNGKPYAPGSTIELSDEQDIEYLQKANAIEELTAEEIAAAEKAAADAKAEAKAKAKK